MSDIDGHYSDMWPAGWGTGAHKFLLILATEYVQTKCCNFKQKERSFLFF